MQPPPPLAPGQTFAQGLVVGALLTATSTRAVYAAELRGGPCTLSVWSPDLAPDPAARDRFVRGAQGAGVALGPYVPAVLGAGVDARSQSPWVITEALVGAPLAAVVAHHGPLDDTAAYAVLRAVCDALSRAHAAGKAHLGLSTDSVFLTDGPEGTSVQVLDFGAADIAAAHAAAAVAHPPEALLWMAPELAQPSPGSPPGPAADVWSLGLLAFYALTGAAYWRAAYGETLDVRGVFTEVMFAPMEGARDRAGSYGIHGRLPPRFDAWFARCVTRDLPDRYPDAAAAWEGLAAALTLPPPAPAPARPRPSRRPSAPPPAIPPTRPPPPLSEPPSSPSLAPAALNRPGAPAPSAAMPAWALAAALALVLLGAAGAFAIVRRGWAPTPSDPSAPITQPVALPTPGPDPRVAREALARAALDRAAEVARLCGDGSGASAEVTARYDGQGSVTETRVAPPLHDTPVGECVVTAVRETSLPPDPAAPAVTVSRTMPLR